MAKFDVVISGISGRFPDCDDLDTFKNRLYNAEDFISFDDRKWARTISFDVGKKTVPYGTGKFSSISDYDAMVFRLNKMFARSTDVINRKILEPAFEAIVDAGMNPYSLSGRNVGVFTTHAISEVDSKACIDDRGFLLIIGGSKTMMANRISFTFDLKGPSLTYAADAFGSFEALAAAYKQIADGYVEAAIVGACSHILEPAMSLNYLHLDFLSKDAATRVFSKDACGYARSESCVVFVLQRAEDAKRVYAKVNLCDTYFEGCRMAPLLHYDELYLKKAFQTIYQNHKGGNVDPSDLAFLEMNACGVKKFDSIETNVANEFFHKGKHFPLLVGSVKSNIGHTEGAAPFMSLLKALLAFETSAIAPNIHVDEIDHQLKPLDQGKLQVITKRTQLPGDRIGVNAISMFGSVGHVSLQKQKQNVRKRDDTISDQLPRLLLMCGRSETSLTDVIETIESKPFNAEFISLTNDAFGTYMPAHIYRGYTILPKRDPPIHEIQARRESGRPVWYLFTGMGSQWSCMGAGLLELPIFADVVKRSDAVLKPFDIDIYRVLCSDDPSIFDNIVNSFVGIITVQIGLTEILRAIGLQPDGIIGHSVGENACAYADGCLTLEQAVMASYARGVASTEVPTVKGMMAAVGKGYNDLKDSLPGNVEIACHNSAGSCTLSGPAEEVENFVAELQKQKIFAKAVNVANIAYHSKNIAPAGPGLVSRLKKVIPFPKKRSSKWISTSIPEAKWDQPLAESCSPEYLTNNLLNPVLFEEGCKHIPNNAIVVEIAPHGLLQAIVKKSLPELCTNIPLTRRSEDKQNLNFLLSALGKLYITGCDVNVNELFPKVSYPVPTGTPAISPYCTWDRTTFDLSCRHMLPITMKPLWGDLIRVCVNDDAEHVYLRHHKVHDKIIIPTGFFIHLVWWIISIFKNEKVEDIPILFEDVKVHKTVTVSLKKPRLFSVMIQRSGYFEILLQCEENVDTNVVIASGNVTVNAEARVANEEPIQQPVEPKVKMEAKAFYDVLAQSGYRLDDCFASVRELTCDRSDYFSEIRWRENNWTVLFDSLMKLSMFSRIHQQRSHHLVYPSFIRKLLVHAPQKIANSKTSDAIIMCHNDTIQNCVRCSGIEMFGVEFEPFSKKLATSTTQKTALRCYKFVEYFNPLCPDIRSFLKVCLRIVAQHLALVSNSKRDKLCIVENSDSLTKMMVKLVKEIDGLKTRTVFRTAEQCYAKFLQTSKVVLKISDHEYVGNGLSVDQLFLLLTERKSTKIPVEVTTDFVQVTKQSFGEDTLHLFKKIRLTDNQPTQIFANDENNCRDIHEKTPLTNSPSKVMVVRKNIANQDLSIILSDDEQRDKKYLYVLDDKNPSIDLDDEQIGKIFLSLDWPVHVWKNGRLGFYKDVTDETELNGRNEKNALNRFLANSIELKGVESHYFIPETDFQNEKRRVSRTVGYAGIHISGQHVIGITRLNSNQVEHDIHPDFVWTIPKTWNLKEAASISHVFPIVYNILRQRMESVYWKTVLINMGDEYLLTEACILVALNAKYTVFVTVSNHREAKAIEIRFPQVKKEHILDADKYAYEFQMALLTGGKGANVVINCLAGVENAAASLRCVSSCGMYVEVGERNLIKENRLGLFSFLNSAHMRGVPMRVSKLLDLHEDDRKELQRAMQAGICDGVVQPLRGNLSGNQRHDETPSRYVSKTIVKNLQRREKGCRGITRKLRYGTDYSYIIVGNEKEGNNDWYDCVEWLVSKGARKFILAVDNEGSKITREMRRRLNEQNISVVSTTVQKTDNVDEAIELLDEASKLGPPEAIFFVGTECASKRIRNVDVASQRANRSTRVISVLSGGLDACERRRENGYPALVVHTHRQAQTISSIFTYIDDILSGWDGYSSPTLYEIVDRTSPRCDGEIDYNALNDHLPTDLRQLEDIGYRITKKSQFLEIASLSLPYAESVGIYPVFVIPSVRTDRLEPLIRKIMYPVFWATLAESGETVHEIAADLFTELKKIQPTGPVTLIGETWTAGIAIELSILIDNSERQCKLLLVEGNPNKWKNNLNQLGAPYTLRFDSNILKSVLNLPKITDATASIENDSSFEDYAKKCLSTFYPRDLKIDYVVKALMALRRRMSAAALYEPPKQLWNNIILLLQRYTEDPSFKISVTGSIITLDEDDYEIFIQDRRISEIVNNNALFSWWDYTKCD